MNRVGPGFQAPNYFGPWIPADKIDDFETSKKLHFWSVCPVTLKLFLKLAVIWFSLFRLPRNVRHWVERVGYFFFLIGRKIREEKIEINSKNAILRIERRATFELFVPRFGTKQEIR